MIPQYGDTVRDIDGVVKRGLTIPRGDGVAGRHGIYIIFNCPRISDACVANVLLFEEAEKVLFSEEMEERYFKSIFNVACYVYSIFILIFFLCFPGWFWKIKTAEVYTGSEDIRYVRECLCLFRHTHTHTQY
jgi:hypothetical protein